MQNIFKTFKNFLKRSVAHSNNRTVLTKSELLKESISDFEILSLQLLEYQKKYPFASPFSIEYNHTTHFYYIKCSWSVGDITFQGVED